MDSKDQFIIDELKRMANECRLRAKGAHASMALMRVASSLHSLVDSLNDQKLPHSPLTKRESEILFHVSQGFTNREIASALEISEKTIEFHLKSIFSKTESASRVEAVSNSFKNKWL